METKKKRLSDAKKQIARAGRASISRAGNNDRRVPRNVAGEMIKGITQHLNRDATRNEKR